MGEVEGDRRESGSRGCVEGGDVGAEYHVGFLGVMACLAWSRSLYTGALCFLARRCAPVFVSVIEQQAIPV